MYDFEVCCQRTVQDMKGASLQTVNIKNPRMEIIRLRPIPETYKHKEDHHRLQQSR